MIKLSTKYRKTAAHILNRDWANARDKYWALDSVALVAMFDTKSPTQDLQILSRLQSKLITKW